MDIEKGFYYHYKHDPKGTLNNYAYEVMGLGHHTEIDGLVPSAMVMYRPLYDASVYTAGKHWDLRPYMMFTETVSKDGNIIPRFQKITDPVVIAELVKKRDEMYG